MANGDNNTNDTIKRVNKAPAYHSMLSEHFQENFPLFLNRWVEGFDLREHDHAYWEIVYVLTGEGYHYVGDSVEKALKGKLYILPVGTSHLFRPSSTAKQNNLLVINLCIRPDFIDSLKQWLMESGGDGEVFNIFSGETGTHVSLTDKNLELGRLFEELHREYHMKQWGFAASLFAGTLQLIVRISRLLTEYDSLSASTTTGAVHSRKIDLLRMLDYIQGHITEPLTIEDLATQTGVSKRHFIRLFKQTTGMGFSEYIQQKRIELACRLLRETDDKIDYIAKCVGYKDSSHFRKLFNTIIGTSPQRYRTACNSGEIH